MSDQPSVYLHEGVTVRKGSKNILSLRIDEATFVALIDESKRTGLPLSELIRISSQPCSLCKTIHVVTRNNEGEFVQVKRGLICQPYKKQSSGTGIIEQNKNKNESAKQ